MTGEEAVAYYHSLLRFGIRPGLERISALCGKLGDPQKKLRFIHVAGTNGKGSVCTELAGILQAAGYRVGLYTSPYVIDFRERIRLNGEMISPEALGQVTETVKRVVDDLQCEGTVITEFEAITAAAFVWYSRAACDFVVLETGLGGRFDATNVIDPPPVCVITSVSMDHMAVLGDTTEKIAFEKAGIIKNGCDVVASTTQEPGVLRVLREKCAEASADLRLADPETMVRIRSASIRGTEVCRGALTLTVPFPGSHQVDNFCLVLRAVDCLRARGFGIPDAAVKTGVENAFIPARTEMLSADPLVILDGSHNDGSTGALAAVLADGLPGKKILAVMGMMADKDHDAVFSHLLPLFTDVICVTPSNPRAISAGQLAEAIRCAGGSATSVEDPKQGIDLSLREINSYDALVVCGSLYLAGDVRDYLIHKLNRID